MTADTYTTNAGSGADREAARTAGGFTQPSDVSTGHTPYQPVSMADQAAAVARARTALQKAKQKQAARSMPRDRDPQMPVSTFYFWAYGMK